MGSLKAAQQALRELDGQRARRGVAQQDDELVAAEARHRRHAAAGALKGSSGAAELARDLRSTASPTE